MKSDGFKWWHAALGIAAVAAVAWGGFSFLRGGSGERPPSMAESITMVDVNTGDLFVFDISGRRAVMVPEKNPQTGEASLLGAFKTPEGKWVISERHRVALARIQGSKSAIVDVDTGEVRVTSESPKRGRP